MFKKILQKLFGKKDNVLVVKQKKGNVSFTQNNKKGDNVAIFK